MENESQVWNQSTPQPLANTTSYNYPSENEYVRLFGDSDGYWIFSTNDIPILIGAVAGAIGLLLIILAAVVIWHCCQFALQREKSTYSLDNESERDSIASQGSHILNSESTSFGSKLVSRNTNDIRRSLSNSFNNPLSQEERRTRYAAMPNRSIGAVIPNIYNKSYSTMTPAESESDVTSQIQSTASELPITECLSQRNHMYLPTQDTLDESQDTFDESLKGNDISWVENKESSDISADHERRNERDPKVNFSKKRKNRMRNDSAAAIAINLSCRSSTTPAAILHKDTDTLVDNEAVVVFDERTAL